MDKPDFQTVGPLHPGAFPWGLAAVGTPKMGKSPTSSSLQDVEPVKSGGETLINHVAEGSLEVKLPTICRDGKAEVGRVSEEKSRSEKLRDGERQKKEDAGARKGRKVAIHCVFPMIWVEK